MIYLEVVLVIVALVFSVMGLMGVQSKINLMGWAILLICIALMLPRAVVLVVR